MGVEKGGLGPAGGADHSGYSKLVHNSPAWNMTRALKPGFNPNHATEAGVSLSPHSSWVLNRGSRTFNKTPGKAISHPNLHFPRWHIEPSTLRPLDPSTLRSRTPAGSGSRNFDSAQRLSARSRLSASCGTEAGDFRSHGSNFWWEFNQLIFQDQENDSNPFPEQIKMDTWPMRKRAFRFEGQ